MDILRKYFYGQLSSQDECRVQEWLAEHGEDPQVIEALENIMSELENSDDSGVAESLASVKNRLGLRTRKAGRILMTVARWTANAAVIVLLPLLGAFIYRLWDPETEWNELKVPYGQTAELSLPDGSHLFLNAGSRITYPTRFDGSERRVFVEGEVFAEVVKNPEQPFTICSGDVNVKVFGTTFNFKSYGNTECVELLLLDGSVRMDVSSANCSKQITLAPGQMVQYDRTSGEVDLKYFSPLRYRGFHENRALHFYNLTLSDIATDLERYFGTKVVLMDEAIADKRYFALFTNNETLEQILMGINVDGNMKFYKKDGVIYITKK